MNAEQFLTKMNNLSAICPQITQFPDYDDIVQGLKEEIALKTQKKRRTGEPLQSSPSIF